MRSRIGTCQQFVEKLLKAIIAQHGKENLPIHNLNRLAELAILSGELEEGQIDLLAELIIKTEHNLGQTAAGGLYEHKNSK